MQLLERNFRVEGIQEMKDRYAVAVMKDGMIIGHLPWKIFWSCSLFLRRGNSTTCVMGHRRYFSDLLQGGLEIPCVLMFEGKIKEILKIKKFLKKEVS